MALVLAKPNGEFVGNNKPRQKGKIAVKNTATPDLDNGGQRNTRKPQQKRIRAVKNTATLDLVNGGQRNTRKPQQKNKKLNKEPYVHSIDNGEHFGYNYQDLQRLTSNLFSENDIIIDGKKKRSIKNIRVIIDYTKKSVYYLDSRSLHHSFIPTSYIKKLEDKLRDDIISKNDYENLVKKMEAKLYRRTYSRFVKGNYAYVNGTKEEVFFGIAKKTTGKLTKSDLLMDTKGMIISKKKHNLGKARKKNLTQKPKKKKKKEN